MVKIAFIVVAFIVVALLVSLENGAEFSEFILTILRQLYHTIEG